MTVRVALALLLLLSFAGCRPEPRSTPALSTPKRVASLVPSATELIYEIGAQDLLMAVTENDNYPPEAAKFPKVGDQTIDKEKLLSLKPDLVILDTEFNRDQAQLERLGLKVLPLQSRRVTDIARNIRLLGRHLGREESAETAARAFETKLRATQRLKEAPSVFIEIWGSPLMTVGGESLPNDLLEILGLHNTYEDQMGYFQVDPEDVLRRRPDVIILPSASSTEQSSAAKLLERAGVSVRVIVLDGDLFTNPTPRVLQGLEIVRRELDESQR